MPVKRPKRKKVAGPVRTSGVATKKNSGVARRAGRGKLGGGVLTAPGTKRAGKPKRKPPMRPGLAGVVPGSMGMSIGGGPKKPAGGNQGTSPSRPAAKKKKNPAAR